MKSTALYAFIIVLGLWALQAHAQNPASQAESAASTSAPATAASPTTASAPAQAPHAAHGKPSAPTSDEITRPGGPVTRLFPIGLVALVIWIISCFGKTKKFLLPNTPGRVNALEAPHLIGLFLLLILLSAIVEKTLSDEFHRVLGLMGIQVILIVACLFVAHYTFRLGAVKGMGLSLRRWRPDLVRSLIGYVVILPVVVLLSFLFRWLLPQQYVHTNDMLVLMNNLGPAGKWAIVLSAVVLAPLCEELFYRGLLQSALRRYLHSPWLAVLMASAFFALMHQPAWQDVVPLFALAIAMGYNYERTGRLLSAILIHALFNAVMLWQFAFENNLF